MNLSIFFRDQINLMRYLFPKNPSMMQFVYSVCFGVFISSDISVMYDMRLNIEKYLNKTNYEYNIDSYIHLFLGIFILAFTWLNSVELLLVYNNSIIDDIDYSKYRVIYFYLMYTSWSISCMFVDTYFNTSLIIYIITKILIILHMIHEFINYKLFIKSLKDNYKKDKYQTQTSCPICLEEYQENIEIAKLSCKHIYHKECIKSWFKMKFSCPYCCTDMSLLNKINL
jgi:hypothetical protein